MSCTSCVSYNMGTEDLHDIKYAHALSEYNYLPEKIWQHKMHLFMHIMASSYLFFCMFYTKFVSLEVLYNSYMMKFVLKYKE